jgi:copper(I)-binding protein
MAMASGVMTMRMLSNGLAVPSGSKVELKPSGFHLMFQGLKRGLKEGEHFKVTLQFEKAGLVPVDFTVGSIAAAKAPEPGSHGH